MGIGSTSLNLSFSQVLGFHSSSIAVIFQDPEALDRLLLFAGLMFPALHFAFFGIRHSLGVKSCLILESPTPGSSRWGRLPIFL